MTGSEITAARNQLPPRTQVPWKDWTEEQKRSDRELDCREMINSILIYHGERGVQKGNYFGDKYLADYIRELGEKNVARLCSEQLEDFKKAVVRQNVGRDGEGVTYNSIVWADEMEPLDKKIDVAAEQKNVVQDDNPKKSREEFSL